MNCLGSRMCCPLPARAELNVTRNNPPDLTVLPWAAGRGNVGERRSDS